MHEKQKITNSPPPPDIKTDEPSQQAVARYREGVEELFKLQSSASISNGQPAHAAILFAAFFDHAKTNVRIFCQKLAKDVFGRPEVIQAARRALEKGVVVEVIVQQVPEASEFTRQLVDTHKIQVVNVSNVQGLGDLPINFAVMDDRAIRFEPDRGEFKATAVMNDPKNAKTLGAFFGRLLDLGAKSSEPQPA